MKTQVISKITTGPSFPIYGGNGKNNAAIIRKNFPDVKTVSDSQQAIRIDVTRNDTRRAVPHDHTKCAFARASQRCWNADGACIGYETSYVVFGSHAIRFKTPESVAREIPSFDRHGDFAVGIYRLSPIPPCRRIGRPRGTSTKLKGPKKKNREAKVVKTGDEIGNHRTVRARSYADEDLKMAA